MGVGLLEQVRDAVVVLLGELPGVPARMRVRVEGVEVELDWAAPAPATLAPVTPVSSALAPGGPAPASASAPSSVPARAVPIPSPNGSAPHLGTPLTSSTVGTFYRSPEPGAEPFVEVGDRVKAGQQVGIVEVMKLMIPVEADRDAVIAEVLAHDGESVEYGQPLFALGTVS
ncbi:MAG TPA: biotin/lipoyl-containing protein [Streptomyces sp.]